ncbi:MAG: hypothetical protein CVV41_16135 [Candidatus Riflebacteria bacterium HGW-Riflebacteria-1]|nr:MAG: hypothetical protein CVV41_16135 [Candidatus Riflebacteria bacterium HGW-Riflebacteria-1]
MRFHRLIVIVAVFLALFNCQAGAYEGVSADHPLFKTQQRIFAAIADYWQVQELYIKYTQDPSDENEQTWNSAIKSHTDNSVRIGKDVVLSIKKTDYGQIQMLSEIYRSLPEGAKNALFPTLGYLKFEVTHGDSPFLSEEKFREYFPGYGYSEPGFKYRKGRELDREYKGVTWQYEEQTISTTWNVSLTINIDLIDILKGLVTGGAIKNLTIGETYQMNVGGQPMFVCNVSFQRIKAITTKINRKFEINKVWFELHRTKSSSWSEPVWELCGKTYEILQEPTGEDIVTSIGAK